MEDNAVPFIPTIFVADDVKIEGEEQKTLTQEYANTKDSPEWMMPCARLKTYVHYRVVQGLAYPLASAVSSKEAVQAIRDAIEGSPSRRCVYSLRFSQKQYL